MSAPAILSPGSEMPLSAPAILPSGSKMLLSPRRISRRVARLAGQLNRLLERNPPWLVIGVLRGALIFMADLVRHLNVSIHIDFISISSYGDSRASSGAIRLLHAPGMNVSGRRVLLLDDVLDTGHSLRWLVNYLAGQGAVEVKTCVLLDKPHCRQTEINTDYTGFALPAGYVVGYGMDMAQQYRHLPGIYQLPED